MSEHRRGIRRKSLAILWVLSLWFSIPPQNSNAEYLAPGASPNVLTDLASLSLEDLMKIEVTCATKSPSTISASPASVWVITRDDILRFGYRTLGEALRRVAGVYISSDRNYDYIGVRGISRPGDYNTRVLLLIDGHRINDPIYDTAQVGEDLCVDIETIERIELAKGPASALWGTNALLAVINIVTRKSEGDKALEVTGEYGSYERTKGTAEYRASYPSGLDVAVSFSAFSSDGEKKIYFPEFDNPLTNNGVAENMDDERARRAYISASYKEFSLSYVQGYRRKSIPTASFGAAFNVAGTYTVDERGFAELGYQKLIRPRKNGMFQLRLSHDEYKYRGQYICEGEPSVIIVEKDGATAKWWNAEARYSEQMSDKLFYTFGVEYSNVYKATQEDHYEKPYFSQNVDVSSSYELTSYYLQGDLDISARLRLIAGTRLDHYSKFGEAWSPRVALLYRPSSASTLKLLLGKAFRAPNEYERSFNAPDWQYVPNPNLSPERITSYELTWEHELNPTLRFCASLFHIILKNIITQTETSEGALQFQNFESARSRGFEMSLESRRRDGRDGYVTMAVTDSVDRATRQRLTNSPCFVGTAGMSIPIASRRCFISPEIRYVSRRRTLSGKQTSPALTLNLNYCIPKSSDGWSVSLGVYDIFDKATYSPGAAEHVQDMIPQWGRTFRIRVSRAF